MRNNKLGILTSTICLFIALPIFILGLRVSYVNAYDSSEIPNINEIVFQFDTQEIKNIYDLNLVTVVINGKAQRVLTNRTDINRLLEDLGVVLDNSKKILSTCESIRNGSVIRVITVGTVVEELNIDIPFRVEKVNSRDVPYGETKVVQNGVLGVRTKNIKKIYEDGKLVSEEVLSEAITREPVEKILKVGVLRYSPEDLDVRYGYNCPHWYSVVDEGNYTESEKEWLKFVMYCESGCNAENNKHSVYKGLFQWNPRSWDAYYKNDNIFDGYAQIKNTVDKIRRGVNLYSFWPSCHRKYVATYGEFGN